MASEAMFFFMIGSTGIIFTIFALVAYIGYSSVRDMNEESGAKGFMFYSTGFSMYFCYDDCLRLCDFYE